MRDLCIVGSGILAAEKRNLKTLVNYMGGYYSDQLTENCTHLVTGTVKSMKYLEAGKHKITIMHTDWVQDVWQKSKISGSIVATSTEYDKYKLPVFFNLNVCSSGLTSVERHSVKSMIEENGGKYDGSFKSEIVDILIVDKAQTDSAKFKAAVRYKKECLTIDWVKDSIDQGYALNTSDPKYQVIGLKVSTPTKNDKSVNIADFHGDQTNVCNISRISHITTMSNCDINESVRSTRSNFAVPQFKYKHQIAQLSVSEAKLAGLFLDGCNVSGIFGLNSNIFILINLINRFI